MDVRKLTIKLVVSVNQLLEAEDRLEEGTIVDLYEELEEIPRFEIIRGEQNNVK